VRTTVGYTGGTSSSPTYDSVCSGDGHTEALKVEYDPSVLPYEELMRTVLQQADPDSWSVQYQDAVWPQNEEQREIARSVAQRLGKARVPILDATPWHDAEEYHQKVCSHDLSGALDASAHAPHVPCACCVLARARGSISPNN